MKIIELETLNIPEKFYKDYILFVISGDNIIEIIGNYGYKNQKYSYCSLIEAILCYIRDIVQLTNNDIEEYCSLYLN